MADVEEPEKPEEKPTKAPPPDYYRFQSLPFLQAGGSPWGVSPWPSLTIPEHTEQMDDGAKPPEPSL